MNYPNIRPAVFLRRPNRFVAQAEVDGREETVHVKNTGRCRELLVPGCTVWLTESGNPERKTRYDLVAVEKGREEGLPLLVNMDSQAPNAAFGEFVRSGGFLPGVTLVQPEKTHGGSRFDFYLETGEGRHFVEIKGVTLEEGGHCRFPDAPTQRGRKHLEELAQCRQEGFGAWLCFVVQMDGMADVRPNDQTDPAFGRTLRQAAQAGVEVRAFGCRVTPGCMEIAGELPVILEEA